MRRILLICCTLVFVLMMAVSGFATTVDQEDSRYADLQFDFIELGNSGSDSPYAVFPWPANGGVKGSTVHFEYDSGNVVGDYSLSDDVICNMTVDFSCPADYIALTTNNLFVTPQALIGEDYTIRINSASGADDDMWIESIGFSGNVAVWELNDKSVYELNFYPFDMAFGFDEYSVSIGETLVSVVYSLDLGHADNPSLPIFFYDLRIDVEFHNGTINTPYVLITANNLTEHATVNNTLAFCRENEFYDGEVIIKTETVYVEQEFEVGTFLADSVNSFLQTEIFPGFTIDNIFYIILVLAIVLAFTKIMS